MWFCLRILVRKEEGVLMDYEDRMLVYEELISQLHDDDIADSAHLFFDLGFTEEELQECERDYMYWVYLRYKV